MNLYHQYTDILARFALWNRSDQALPRLSPASEDQCFANFSYCFCSKESNKHRQLGWKEPQKNEVTNQAWKSRLSRHWETTSFASFSHVVPCFPMFFPCFPTVFPWFYNFSRDFNGWWLWWLEVNNVAAKKVASEEPFAASLWRRRTGGFCKRRPPVFYA